MAGINFITVIHSTGLVCFCKGFFFSKFPAGRTRNEFKLFTVSKLHAKLHKITNWPVKAGLCQWLQPFKVVIK